MELDAICQNCAYFFSHTEDFEEGLGICTQDEEFDPFMDDVIENSDFSCCYDLYLESVLMVRGLPAKTSKKWK